MLISLSIRYKNSAKRLSFSAALSLCLAAEMNRPYFGVIID